MKFYGSTRMQQMLTYLKNYLTDKFNGKQDTLTFDEVPTENSRNPVRSGGIFNALATKIDGSGLATVATTGQYSDLNGKPTVDSALSDSSTNAVQNKVVKTVLDGKVNDNDSRLSDARTPLAHTHPASDITGIPSLTWTLLKSNTASWTQADHAPNGVVVDNLFSNLATFKNTYKELMVVATWYFSTANHVKFATTIPTAEIDDVLFVELPISHVTNRYGHNFEPSCNLYHVHENEYEIWFESLWFQDDINYTTRTNLLTVLPPTPQATYTCVVDVYAR